MVSGRAVNRVVRGHLLIDAALNTILIADSYNVHVPCKIIVVNTEGLNAGEECEEDIKPEECMKNTDLEKARELYYSLFSGIASVDEACLSDILNQMQNNLQMKKESQLSHTAFLWLQYMTMIDISRMFLKAK